MIYILSIHLIYFLYCASEYNILRGSRSTSLPYVQAHPTSQHICHIGTGTVMLTNLTNRRVLEKQRGMHNQNYQFFNISKCGMYIATIARASMVFELSVIHQEGLSFSEHDTITCHTVCPTLLGGPLYTERVECRFSPDSELIAVGSNMGHLFVVKKWRLQTFSILAPQTTFPYGDNVSVDLSNERSFDFSPTVECGHHILAFATQDQMVYIMDMESNELVHCIEIPINQFQASTIQSVKYSTRGDMIAVAPSTGHVYVMCTLSGDLLLNLDGSEVCTDAAMTYNNHLQKMPSTLHMSFSQSNDLLAVSSTDGIIRVWQLPCHIQLLQLCRMAILKIVNMRELRKLPLPNKLINYLFAWPHEH